MTDINISELIDEKSDDNFGVFATLRASSQHFSPEDFQLFCENSLTGGELWLDFTAKRDAPNAPDGYGMPTYIGKIITEAKAKAEA